MSVKEMFREIYEMFIPKERQSMRNAMRYWCASEGCLFTFKNGRITK